MPTDGGVPTAVVKPIFQRTTAQRVLAMFKAKKMDTTMVHRIEIEGTGGGRRAVVYLKKSDLSRPFWDQSHKWAGAMWRVTAWRDARADIIKQINNEHDIGETVERVGVKLVDMFKSAFAACTNTQSSQQKSFQPKPVLRGNVCWQWQRDGYCSRRACMFAARRPD